MGGLWPTERGRLDLVTGEPVGQVLPHLRELGLTTRQLVRAVIGGLPVQQLGLHALLPGAELMPAPPAGNRPHLVARVFQVKLTEVVKDLVDRHYLGKAR